MVLIHMAPTQLPLTEINVPGPGPIESHSPVPEKRSPIPQTNEKQEELADGDTSSDQEEETEPKVNDPYANLGGAFGNYLADEPRPMAAMDGRGRKDLDDLLL
jgi:AP-2 complex subunit beta-1